MRVAGHGMGERVAVGKRDRVTGRISVVIGVLGSELRVRNDGNPALAVPPVEERVAGVQQESGGPVESVKQARQRVGGRAGHDRFVGDSLTVVHRVNVSQARGIGSVGDRAKGIAGERCVKA